MEFKDWEYLAGKDSLLMRAPSIEALDDYLNSFSAKISPPDCLHLGLINSKFKYLLKDYLEERKIMTKVESVIDTAQVFVAPELRCFDLRMLKILENMVECGKPQTLIRVSDNKQVAINQGFVDILNAPTDLVCGRNVKIGWNPPDLEECKRLMEQQSKFSLKYGSAFNTNLYAVSSAEIEVLEIGGEIYRLNTNIDWKQAEWPEHMLQVRQFEW